MIGTAADRSIDGVGRLDSAQARLETALWTSALSLPARQNAKRIAHSRRRHDFT